MFAQENYGKADPANVATVKALYKELDIEVGSQSYEISPRVIYVA